MVAVAAARWQWQRRQNGGGGGSAAAATAVVGQRQSGGGGGSVAATTAAAEWWRRRQRGVLAPITLPLCPHRSPVPSRLPSVDAARFLLIVAFFYNVLQPFKVVLYFNVLYFL